MTWEPIVIGLCIGQVFGELVKAFAEVMVNELFTYRRYRKSLSQSERQ